MNRRLLIVLLALPLLGLAANIAFSVYRLRDASAWRIPVTGYDPRDPLRGHFVQFRYDWSVAGDAAVCTPRGCSLCLEAGGSAVRMLKAGEVCAHRVDTAASDIDVRRASGDPPQFFSRIFVSEASAPGLEAKLRASPMVVAARLGNDGRLVNERLEPARGDYP